MVLFAAVHMSLPGPSRHCVAAQRFGRTRSDADTIGGTERIYEYTP